jgi:hypothetical protein
MAGVSVDSLRETLHPVEYEARIILGGKRSSLVPESLGVREGTSRRTKNSFRHGLRESESLGILGEEQK